MGIGEKDNRQCLGNIKLFSIHQNSMRAWAAEVHGM